MTQTQLRLIRKQAEADVLRVLLKLQKETGLDVEGVRVTFGTDEPNVNRVVDVRVDMVLGRE